MKRMRRNGRSSADLHDPSAGTGLAGRLVPCPNGRNPTTPPSPDEGQPIAIALSGGGFRATLTALGALRLLQDADLLKQVRYVSSVSGGSIAAALAATRWDETLDVGLDAAVIDPLVHDISTRSLTATIVKNLWRTLGDTSRTDLLARILDEWWFDGATLEELAEPIRWIINATNQNTASRFGFERDRLGDYISGEISTRGLRIGVATAVAASAAVPGLFPPLQLAPDIRFACPDVGAPRLIDGGTYDNTGLTAIEHHTYDDTLTFALNAGGTFTIGAYGKLPIVRDLQTANSILYRQTNTLRQQDFKIRNWRFQQALAAGADDVFADLIDQHHLRAQAAADHGIDGAHVFSDRGEQDGGGGLGQGEFRQKTCG